MWCIDCRIFEEVPISKVGAYVILVEGEAGQHNEPHLHIRTRKGVRMASVAIYDGRTLAGVVPRQIRKPLKSWIGRHCGILLAKWKEAGQGHHPDPLDFDE